MVERLPAGKLRFRYPWGEPLPDAPRPPPGSLDCLFERNGEPYTVDFAAIARGFGARGISVRSAAELGPALKEALASDLGSTDDQRSWLMSLGAQYFSQKKYDDAATAYSHAFDLIKRNRLNTGGRKIRSDIASKLGPLRRHVCVLLHRCNEFRRRLHILCQPASVIIAKAARVLDASVGGNGIFQILLNNQGEAVRVFRTVMP